MIFGNLSSQLPSDVTNNPVMSQLYLQFPRSYHFLSKTYHQDGASTLMVETNQETYPQSWKTHTWKAGKHTCKSSICKDVFFICALPRNCQAQADIRKPKTLFKGEQVCFGWGRHTICNGKTQPLIFHNPESYMKSIFEGVS